MKWFFWILNDLKSEIQTQYSWAYFCYLVGTIFVFFMKNEYLTFIFTFIILCKISIHDIQHLEILESDQIILLSLHISPLKTTSEQFITMFLIVGILVYFAMRKQLGWADVQLFLISYFILKDHLEQVILMSSLMALIYHYFYVKDAKKMMAFGPFISFSVFFTYLIKLIK